MTTFFARARRGEAARARFPSLRGKELTNSETGDRAVTRVSVTVCSAIVRVSGAAATRGVWRDATVAGQDSMVVYPGGVGEAVQGPVPPTLGTPLHSE